MTFQITTDERLELIDVTTRVTEQLPSDIDRGVCTIFVPHTTAGVIVNEYEPRLLADLEGMLEGLVSDDGAYEHDAIDDNAAAHLRATILGESASIPVVDGELALGTWQSVIVVECDGPRTRSLEVAIARE
ncbi:MAG: secondary thiamine-phosphate synthase enzyme YjbQ [Halodesulfurarchaeum sp.]